MALGDITTTDLNGWQYRAVGVLDSLVKAGLKAERYPLDEEGQEDADRG
ncbi:hypothetical protein [Streptomyces sp. NPDC001108]